MIVFAGGVASAAPRNAPPRQPEPEDIALAERFAELGRRMLQTKNPGQVMWQQAAAMMEAANALNPYEERYVRLLAEYDTQARDSKGAIAAYYKLLQLNPEHRGARLALIDIYLQGLETADRQLAYLKDMMGPRGKYDEVRSYAATRAAKIYLERAQKDPAMAMLSQALRLNPLNYEAAVMHGQLLPANATPLERVRALISILRINPGEPDYSLALARQLGQLGMLEQSLIWYTTSGNTILKLGQTAPVPMVVEYACELYLSDQIANTKLVATNLLTADDNSTEAWTLRLLLDKEDKNQDPADQQKAMLAMINRLQMARKAAGVTNATTRPVSTKTPVEIPDLSGDIASIQATAAAAKDKTPAQKEQELRGAYVSTITDLLWDQAYFAKQPADPKLTNFLRTLLGPNSPAVARVEGWDLINQNKLPEAKVKLSAAADSDPLSKMGLILIEAKDPKQLDAAKAEAKALLNQHPAGPIAAMLYGGLKELGAKIEAAKESQAVDTELRTLPRDWVFVMDTPQNYYTVRVDPLQISHDFSEPILAQVTIQNVSDVDLPIGANCVLHPDLVFDVEQPGAQGPQNFAGCAYDRMTEQVVLKAKKSMALKVRIDQGQQITEYLIEHPTSPVLMRIAVTTNPMTSKDPQGHDMINAGPAGQRVQMPRVVERRATILTNEAGRQKVFSRLTTGSGADKMRTMEVLSVTSMLIFARKDSDEEQKSWAQEFQGKVFNFSDPSPSVMAWNSFLKTAMGTPQESQDAVRAMAASPAWTMQLLSMVPARAMPAPEERAIVESLTRSSSPIIAKFAQARLEMLNQLASQNPAPGSTTQPSQPAPTAAQLGPTTPGGAGGATAANPAPAVASDPNGAGAQQPPSPPTK